MQPKPKTKTIMLVAVTVVTVILAIVAVVTALKLKEFALIPVAPNAPESQPEAATAANAKNAACQTTFVLASPSPSPTPTPPPGSVTCESKTAYKGTTKLVTGDTVAVGDTLTYKIKLTSSDANQTGSSTVTDVLAAGLTYVSADTNCTYNQLNRTLTCTTTDPLDEITFGATINASASGSVSNTATVTGPDTKTSTCTVSVNLKTPTSCNSECDVDADCEGNLICDNSSGRCRNPSCTDKSDCVCATPTPTPTPTPTATPLSGCNDECTVDADCTGNLICESDQCRNPSCTESSTCVCTTTTTTTATPVPEVKLPTAGNPLPTASVLLIGLGIITLGVVGMLGL